MSSVQVRVRLLTAGNLRSFLRLLSIQQSFHHSLPSSPAIRQLSMDWDDDVTEGLGHFRSVPAMSTGLAAKHPISAPSRIRSGSRVFSRRRKNNEERRLPVTLELLVLSMHMTKPLATLGRVVKPLGSLRPHVLQLLPLGKASLGKASLGKAFQQHQPSPGRYMSTSHTSRRPSLGYWESQPTTSKLYWASYKNMAHHDQGPCKETPSLSGEVGICPRDFLI